MKKLALILLLLAGGCTTVPFAETPRSPAPPGLSPAELAARAWPANDARYRIRQTVLFELRGAKVPMTGLMDLDNAHCKIRLVAVNDLGVKFFDLQLDRSGETLHYLLPELARFPDFGQVVADAVRRIFLAPRPSGVETLAYRDGRYILQRRDAGTTLRFVFGGDGPHLLAKQATGAARDWRIDYYEHPPGSAPVAPHGIVLKDDRHGYRLTLWLDEVTRHAP